MSHVVTLNVEIKDLKALAEAAKRIGMEFMENQLEYEWYGRHVGDYPLPQGFTAEDMGKCDHAIRIPGKPGAYEVGVVRRKDGRPGYTLIYDFWHGGNGLEAVVGANCQKLTQNYAAVVAKKQAMRIGYKVREQVQHDGTIKMLLTRG